jgi:hypothetical protein
MSEDFKSRPAAAEYLRARWGLRCSAATLAKLAVLGGGPEYRKAGRFPVYEIAALDAYAKAKLSPMSYRSTAEYAA